MLGNLGIRSLLSGDMYDFTVDWYSNVGIPVIRIMWLTVVLQFDLIPFFWIKCKRFTDRGCSSKTLVKDKNGKEVLNTKLKTHEEVVELYTGPEIESHSVYSA